MTEPRANPIQTGSFLLLLRFLPSGRGGDCKRGTEEVRLALRKQSSAPEVVEWVQYKEHAGINRESGWAD